MTTDNRTSVFVEEQFPLFARSSGQQLVTFIKKYYESQEQANNYVEAIHNLLNYQDIDTAPEEYFDYIAREIIPSIPERLLANRELLAKHIKEIYRVRGNPAGYRVLFRALFDEEINLYNPGDDILRASDGRWVKETAVNIPNTLTGNVFDLPGNKIIGQTSGTSALVDRVELAILNSITTYTIYLSNIIGESFALGETIFNIDNTISFNVNSSARGPIIEATLTEDGGSGHNVGDRVSITSTSGGSGALGTVIQTRADSAAEFYIVDGGTGYSTNTILNATSTFGSGSDAAFVVTSVGAPLVNLPIYDDFVYYFANVVIGDSDDAVVINGRTTFVQYPDDTTCTFQLTGNTITRTDHGYSNGDIVRFFYATGNTNPIGITTSEPPGPVTSYYVINATDSTFNVAAGPGSAIEVDILEDAAGLVTRASSDLSLSNVNSLIGDSLGTSDVETGTITAISTINNGYGYYDGAPTGTVDFRKISEQALDDGSGGLKGLNADIQSSFLSGTISKIQIDIQGNNYTNEENIILINSTSFNTVNAVAIAESSAIIQLSGKYINTKGWLSWDKYLQDNNYYQEFSYEIRSNQNFSSYESTITNTLHPAGTKMFGAIYSQSNLDLTLEDYEQIDTYTEVLNITPASTDFIQNSNTQNDRIEYTGTPLGSVAANDFVYITGPTPDISGSYRISAVLNSNTLLLYNSAVTVIANTVLQPISGNTTFTTTNITVDYITPPDDAATAASSFNIDISDTVTRGAGSWIDDGYQVGGNIVLTGAEDPSNDGTYLITDVTTLILTVDSTSGPGSDGFDTTNIDDTTVSFSTVGFAFDLSADTVTRNDGGSWIDDGYQVGGNIVVTGAEDPSNDGTYTITVVAASILTVDSTSGPGSDGFDTTNAEDTTVSFSTGFGDFTAASVGDDIFITNAANEDNNGGPFIITNKVSSQEIQVTTYAAAAPFTASVDDKVAKIEIIKQYAIQANSAGVQANTVIFRHVDTYPYSNNTVVL
tara:strand:+ start:1473 stop:4463 length:2991 start_codon:yes stop_codon:yes gene_type:complete